MPDNYKIVRYNKNDFKEWNGFLERAKNATFLFHRNFIEYHGDRFEDYSLMIYKKDKLIALLPANRINETIYSHQGLSYGGIIFTSHLKFSGINGVLKSVLRFLKKENIKFLRLKCLPYIYNKIPGDELMHLFYVLKAKLIDRQLNSVIKIQARTKYSASRTEGVRRGIKSNLQIKEVETFDDFWNEILIPNLYKKYAAKPVHTLEEITLLKSRFSNEIRQFNVYLDNEIVAGATIFESIRVSKLQYISTKGEKNKIGSLDYLMSHLIEDVFSNKDYFDLGTSRHFIYNTVNSGLLFWKEGFGARTVTSDVYEVDINNLNLLDSVMS